MNESGTANSPSRPSDAARGCEGLVVRAMGNQVRVLIEGREHRLPVPGRWRQISAGVRPLASGDRIRLQRSSGGFRVVDILPRENEFTRRLPGPRPAAQTIAANLDLVVVVASAAQPQTPPGLVDRLLVTAFLGDVPGMLLMNKIDLVELDRLVAWQMLFKGAVPCILFTSALTGEGVAEFGRLIAGKRVLLVGSSGVGKTTLLNCIEPGLNLKTAEISTSTGKGRHVTSGAELFQLSSGGWLIDTPGIRECAPWGMTRRRLIQSFPEIARVAPMCRFRDCSHIEEDGCAVKGEVGSDRLPNGRYQGFLKLMREALPEGR